MRYLEVKFLKKESRTLSTRIGDRGKWGLILYWYRLSVCDDEKFWKWTLVMVAQQHECISCHWTVHLKRVKMVNFTLSIFSHNKKIYI